MYKCIHAALFYTNKSVHGNTHQYILLLLEHWGFSLCIIDEGAANSLFAFWIELSLPLPLILPL